MPGPEQPPAPPWSGRPAYGQPSGSTPDQLGYGQQPPASGQGGAPHPSLGQLPFGQANFPPPDVGQPIFGVPRKSRRLPKLIAAIVAVVVLIVAGGFAAYNAMKEDDVPVAVASKSGSAAKTTKPAKTNKPGKTNKPAKTAKDTTKTSKTTKTVTAVKIVEPAQLGGRPKTSDLPAAFAKAPGRTSEASALYGTASKGDMVMVQAVAAPVRNPSSDLRAFLAGMSHSGLALENVTSIDAGKLGGVAKCGTGTVQGNGVAVCAWGDKGSMGFLIWYFTEVSEAKSEFLKLRGQIEKRG
ncbi:hypothetical protein AB0J80_30320 [Actinoplanes sp. NPDC049548]|uniref:hypothetical protein n=1 Tax=Actinoplanes sp. NPDC049548 TaxID=3155152 RepID=UPI00344867B3